MAFIIWLPILLKRVLHIVMCLIFLGHHVVGYSEASVPIDLRHNDWSDLHLLGFAVFRIVLPIWSTWYYWPSCWSVWPSQYVILLGLVSESYVLLPKLRLLGTHSQSSVSKGVATAGVSVKALNHSTLGCLGMTNGMRVITHNLLIYCPFQATCCM